jgi:uncharacterized membrane protein
VPLLYAAGALLVSFTVPRLSHNLLPGFVSTVGVSAAIGFYSAIASGMLALTAIVFSLTFLMVQFSATANSPRLDILPNPQNVTHSKDAKSVPVT